MSLVGLVVNNYLFGVLPKLSRMISLSLSMIHIVLVFSSFDLSTYLLFHSMASCSISYAHLAPTSCCYF
jgi:hypothetical protein